MLEVLKKYRIGVLAGGLSSEREISIKSGKAVFGALEKAGLDAVLIDIKEETVSFLETIDIDAAFIALHGRFGEDGALQEKLDKRHLPYTGSGPEASRMALDKLASKKRFAEENLRIPEYRVVAAKEEIPYKGLWFPCVVKPQYEGSSIGLSVVWLPDKMPDAIAKARSYGGNTIIEKYIPGREITVGILQDKALPVVEIIPQEGLYDFNAKYEAADTRYVAPAKIAKDVYQKAQEVGLRAHFALCCRGFSRVDMRMDETGELFVLEVNTIPGLTQRSLLPMAAKAAGIDFTALCVQILVDALSKGAKGGEKAKKTSTENRMESIFPGKSLC